MNKWFRHISQSLSLKLSLGILLMAVPVFVLSLGILFLQSRYIILQEAKERATAVLSTTLQRIDRYLKTVETATNVNDWLVTENLQPDSLLAFSNRIVRLNPHVDGCSISTEPNIFPKYGRYFSAYTIREEDTLTTVIEEEYEYFDKIWYKTPRDLNEPCWVVYYDDADSLEVVLKGLITSYGKPLYNANNRFVAIISSDISLLHLSKAITKEKPYPNSYFFMINEKGNYFIHPDTAKLFTQTIFEDAALTEMGHEMIEGKEGNMRIYLNGKPHLACYHPVTGTPWSLAFICPDEDILQSYNHLTYIILPLLAIGLLLIFLLCRKAVSHSIKPISKLLTQSQCIAAGQYDERIPHSNRTDVVGQLQNSFALMQESLDRHVNDIQRGNTEKAQRNDELVQARQMAEEAIMQKMAFIQNMTHQIRTPLNIVMGFSQVLRDSISMISDEDLREITAMMLHNAKTLNRMMQMLYDSSEIGTIQALSSDQHEKVRCNETAREAIDHTHQLFPDLTVNFQTSVSDECYVLGNHLYLMRCLREILYNSAKYSDRKNISLRITETKDKVCFVFEDTGSGIPEDYLDLMFVSFTKVNDLSEGLGLGLPLTKRHLLTMGGTITLDADYHDGCRFIIELPKDE